MVPFQDEIAKFQKKLWELVLKKLLVLLAILLELPEQYFVERHEYDKASDDYLCYVCEYYLSFFLYLKLTHHRNFIILVRMNNGKPSKGNSALVVSSVFILIERCRLTDLHRHRLW